MPPSFDYLIYNDAAYRAQHHAATPVEHDSQEVRGWRCVRASIGRAGNEADEHPDASVRATTLAIAVCREQFCGLKGRRWRHAANTDRELPESGSLTTGGGGGESKSDRD